MQYEFVLTIPESLSPDILYVSIDFRTAVHLCACGCGNEVVTPISPTDWSFTYDGESISMHPSIGNWALPCKSHYWIRRCQVEWAAQWTDEEIAFGRELDRDAKEKQFSTSSREIETSTTPKETSGSWISRLIDWLKP